MRRQVSHSLPSRLGSVVLSAIEIEAQADKRQWLKTDLGGETADLTVDVGVKELKRIILEADKSQNGKFVNIHVPGMDQYKGEEVPW